MELDCVHGKESQILSGLNLSSCIALSDPDLDRARKFLKDQARHAVIVLDAIGGPSYLDNNCKQTNLMRNKLTLITYKGYK